MGLRNRIKKLELLHQQNTCKHLFPKLQIRKIYPLKIQIVSICGICDKEIERIGTSDELSAAEEILRSFLLERL